MDTVIATGPIIAGLAVKYTSNDTVVLAATSPDDSEKRSCDGVASQDALIAIGLHEA